MKALTLTTLLIAVTVACQAQTPTPAGMQSTADARAKEIGTGVTTFLDKTQMSDVRLAAVEDVPVVIDDAQVKAVASVLRDENETVAVRVKALRLVQHRIDGNDAALTEMLAWLEKPSSARDLRLAVADLLQQFLISSRFMTTRRADIINTLRKVSTDPDPGVREIALSTLIGQGDDHAEQLLIDDLRNPATELLPAETAVALLATNADADTMPVLREVFAKPPNASAQVEAMRALGADPQSRPAIVKVLQDESQPEALRLAAAGTLAANVPEQLPAHALTVVKDEDTSESLRVYSIKAVQTHREGQRVSGKAEASINADPAMAAFDQAVSQLKGHSSAAVREAAQTYDQAAKPPQP